MFSATFLFTYVTYLLTSYMFLYFSQFLYVSKPVKEEIAAEVYEDEVDMRRSGSYLNSSFHSVWSEPGVDPDDFRVNSLVPSERCYHFALGHNLQKVEEIPNVTFK